MDDSNEATLYDRIGGQDAVKRLIVDFYRRVLTDPDLRPFFEDVPVEKLQHMQAEFFSMALDGPHAYSGRPIGEVHAGLGIRPHHLQRFLDHLIETLEGFDIDRDDRYDIVSRVHRSADEITGAVSVDG